MKLWADAGERAEKGEWRASVPNAVSLSLVEECHSKNFSSSIQIYGHFPVESRYHTRSGLRSNFSLKASDT
jgi:hypothetical protein